MGLAAALACAPAQAAVAPRPPFQEGCASAELHRAAGRADPDGLRAALVLGLCRLEDGDAARALPLLDHAARHPTLRAHARVWAGQAALQTGDPPGAVRRLQAAVAESASGAIRTAAHLLLAEAWLQARQVRLAERHAQAAWEVAGRDEDRAAAWKLLGHASELAGRRGEAVRRYLTAWWAFPGTRASEEADRALHRLVGARRPAPPPLARVERARRVRDPRVAAQEWEAALRQGLSGALAAEAHLQLGLLRLGSPQAVGALRRAASHPAYAAQAEYWTGVAWARAGRPDRARRVWQDLLRKHPASPWAARALAALAAGAERQGRLREADRWLERLATRFPGSPLADHARWRRGWLRYRQGDDSGAQRLWLALARDRPGSGVSARALYWAARSRARRGLDPTGLLRAAATGYPHAYYGQRARQRLQLRPPPAPAEAPPLTLPEGRFAPAWLELAALGRYADAAEEARAALRGSPSRQLYRLLAWARAQAGDYPGAVAAAEAVTASGARDRALWGLAYPRFYREAVERWAGAYGLDPLLVLAVVREESRFAPAAVSPAGAVGLMQLLPSTAQGLDPSVRREGLTHPETNVRLGCAYLAGRLRDFHGDLVLALVAYNAGPQAARRFLALHSGDVDEFVERIPYAETRAYVQRVLESYGVYRWLYRGGR